MHLIIDYVSNGSQNCYTTVKAQRMAADEKSLDDLKREYALVC